MTTEHKKETKSCGGNLQTSQGELNYSQLLPLIAAGALIISY